MSEVTAYHQKLAEAIDDGMAPHGLPISPERRKELVIAVLASEGVVDPEVFAAAVDGTERCNYIARAVDAEAKVERLEATITDMTRGNTGDWGNKMRNEGMEAAAKINDGLAAACDAEIAAADDDYHQDFWRAQRGQLKRAAAAIRAEITATRPCAPGPATTSATGS